MGQNTETRCRSLFYANFFSFILLSFFFVFLFLIFFFFYYKWNSEFSFKKVSLFEIRDRIFLIKLVVFRKLSVFLFNLRTKMKIIFKIEYTYIPNVLPWFFQMVTKFFIILLLTYGSITEQTWWIGWPWLHGRHESFAFST